MIGFIERLLFVLANGIRGYINEVRLRGLIKNREFETCGGRFCLCSCDFNRPVSF